MVRKLENIKVIHSFRITFKDWLTRGFRRSIQARIPFSRQFREPILTPMKTYEKKIFNAIYSTFVKIS